MYADSQLWNSTLASIGDSGDGSRERLRTCFTSFRERVGQLVATIPSDVPGLTVHDLTHMDALWEMADVLTGGAYKLNPAEAFVFGGAVLLHDSAMTVCAFNDGIEGLKRTVEFTDALAHHQSILDRRPQGEADSPSSLPEALAISEALRNQHAGKAEELSTQAWESPITGESCYLIGDPELRGHYGHAIGRIAHSHHWNIEEVPRHLGVNLGAFSEFPAEWTVDQVKIALLLRCVDAMHVDDRRAPSFLASIRYINATSLEHWRFQNKLAKPHVEDHKLVYTSKSPFGIDDTAAWNLCFDTLQMIDGELRNANDLHLRNGIQQFHAVGVAGATSAEALARYVEVIGWRPLPLNLQVSDVPHLARTLGGQDLYENPLTPLRELIQNSADAIEARTFADNDFNIDEGLISIRLTRVNEALVFEVEDNGVGMSERTLTSALLDFGFSFWRSSDARLEFPGIQAKADAFRGRYGIGFFSVFMWSDDVSVSTRRHNEGTDSSRVLEFKRGVESRPILRAAGDAEKSSRWTTRVTLQLPTNFISESDDGSFKLHRSTDTSRLEYLQPQLGHHFYRSDLYSAVRLLCGALTIKVNLEIDGDSQQVSLPNWRSCSIEDFTEFFSKVLPRESVTPDPFINTLTELTSAPPRGGRCFISPYVERGVAAVYEKGVFVGFQGMKNAQGVLESYSTNAARDRFSTQPIKDDTDWIGHVSSKAFAMCSHLGEELSIQSFLLDLGKYDPDHVLFIRNHKLLSPKDLLDEVAASRVFRMRLLKDSGEEFVWKEAEKLYSLLGMKIDANRVFPLARFDGSVSESDDVNSKIRSSDESLFVFLRSVIDVIGPSAQVRSQFYEVEGYRKDYIEISIAASG